MRFILHPSSLILLLSLPLFAQYTFGPTRLDDMQDAAFFYPVISPMPEGDLLLSWSSTSESRIATVGQRIGYDGALHGERILFQSVVPGEHGIVCPAKFVVVPLPSGGEAQLIFHS